MLAESRNLAGLNLDANNKLTVSSNAEERGGERNVIA